MSTLVGRVEHLPSTSSRRPIQESQAKVAAFNKALSSGDSAAARSEFSKFQHDAGAAAEPALTQSHAVAGPRRAYLSFDSTNGATLPGATLPIGAPLQQAPFAGDLAAARSEFSRFQQDAESATGPSLASLNLLG
jgi:hypothetical protein